MEEEEKEQRYERIKAIADELVSSERHFSRADLAYELREEGIEGDSFALGRLVWEAYKALGEDPNICEAFVDNSGHRSLVEEFKVSDLTDRMEYVGAVALVTDLLSGSKSAIEAVSVSVEEASREYAPAKKSLLSTKKMVDFVVGTSGVKAVQEEATDIFARYADLVDAYRKAKESIKQSSVSFSDLREDILSGYREWVALLQDLFGEQVRSVAPDIFDFDTIEWLDVDGLFAEVKLAFDTLSGRSAELFSSISGSFKSALAEGLRAQNRFADSRVGLALAAVGMVSHYSKSVRDTAKLKGQLLDLKNDVTRDVTNIRSDMSRLAELYHTINDLYLPQADLFYQYSDRVFDREWERLVDVLYSTLAVKSLVEERAGLYKRMRELEDTMLDARINITYYNDQTSATEELLDSLKESYDKAMETKPAAPSWLSKAATVGISREAYVRRLADWDKGDGEIVRRFEDLRIDLKLFEDERVALERVLKSSAEEAEGLSRRISDLTAAIHERQTLSPELLADAATYLSSILKLLSIARGIIESKPDDRLVHTQTVDEIESVKLPTVITDGIERLRKEVQSRVGSAEALAAEEAHSIHPGSGIRRRDSTSQSGLMGAVSSRLLDGSQEESTEVEPTSPADLLTERSREAVRLSGEALDELLVLKQKQLESKMTEVAYARELARIQEQFRKNMQEIDDRASFIRELRSRVRADVNPDSLRDDLLLLAGDDAPTELTSESISDLLEGKSTIDI